MKYKASNGLEIDLEIIRKNNKNIYFRIKDDLKLYVTCPIYLSSRSINNLIKENEESILRMYDKALKKSKDNELFQYLGQKYYVVLQNDSEITFKDNFVYAPSMDALNEFYNKEVERIFTSEVEIAKKCFTQLP